MDTEEVVDEAELKEGFEVVGDDPIEDDVIAEVEDPLLPVDDDDGSLGEKGEEDEDTEIFNEYLFGDDANAM
jgi:hypothetical protein